MRWKSFTADDRQTGNDDDDEDRSCGRARAFCYIICGRVELRAKLLRHDGWRWWAFLTG